MPFPTHDIYDKQASSHTVLCDQLATSVTRSEEGNRLMDAFYVPALVRNMNVLPYEVDSEGKRRQVI